MHSMSIFIRPKSVYLPLCSSCSCLCPQPPPIQTHHVTFRFLPRCCKPKMCVRACMRACVQGGMHAYVRTRGHSRVCMFTCTYVQGGMHAYKGACMCMDIHKGSCLLTPRTSTATSFIRNCPPSTRADRIPTRATSQSTHLPPLFTASTSVYNHGCSVCVGERVSEWGGKGRRVRTHLLPLLTAHTRERERERTQTQTQHKRRQKHRHTHRRRQRQTQTDTNTQTQIRTRRPELGISYRHLKFGHPRTRHAPLLASCTPSRARGIRYLDDFVFENHRRLAHTLRPSMQIKIHKTDK